jgi:hypothetical protein
MGEKASVRQRARSGERFKIEEASLYLYMQIEMASVRRHVAFRPASDPPATRQQYHGHLSVNP